MIVALLRWTLAASPSVGVDGSGSGNTGEIEALVGFEREASSTRIVNGALEGGFPATLSLGVGPIHICSGSMITPRIVLSAAHCSGDLPLESVVQFGSARFGADADDPEVSIRLESASIHPDYVPLESGVTDGEFDLAVAVLVEDAPVQPVFFRVEPLGPDTTGSVLRSVGYGIDETGEGSGLKRSAELTIRELRPMFLVSWNEDNGGANICSGDSGGPQYAMEDGHLVQWAVHSWADTDCLYLSGSTRTDVGADWILDQVEAVHGSRDLCRVNGNYEDGACDRFCPVVDPDCLPVSLGDGITEPVRACSCGMNRFCSPVVLVALLGLSRRRRV